MAVEQNVQAVDIALALDELYARNGKLATLSDEMLSTLAALLPIR